MSTTGRPTPVASTMNLAPAKYGIPARRGDAAGDGGVGLVAEPFDVADVQFGFACTWIKRPSIRWMSALVGVGWCGSAAMIAV